MSQRYTRYTAFTLAEVLITLGLIGVVAAMTIPNLIANYQKEQTVVGLKKAYSELEQLFLASSVQNGDASSWESLTAPNNVERARLINTYVAPYLSISKNCGFSNTGSCSRIKHYMLDGETELFSVQDYFLVVLNDGKMLYILPASDIYFMYVDINGDKKPNVLGKDTFGIIHYNNYNGAAKLSFPGAGASRNDLITNASQGCNKGPDAPSGVNCGALIQQDGWQIKDDYPWQ